LLEKYGLASPREVLLSSADEIAKVEDLGWPVIAKTTDLRLLHKAKIGAVIQDITSIEQAKEALGKLKEWDPLVVFQEKIKEGVEVIIGAHKDPLWGWYMAVGMGGSLSDTYDDRSYIFLPATKSQMLQALTRTKLAKLLDAGKSASLVDAMYKLQQCVLTTNGITEIEINPLFVSDKKVIAADLKRA
jgi:succinyl-CoA synthetase beta subunit